MFNENGINENGIEESGDAPKVDPLVADSSGTSKTIGSKQLDLLFGGLPASMVATLLAAGATRFVLTGSVSALRLNTWFIFVTIIAVARLATGIVYKRGGFAKLNLVAQHMVFWVGTTFAGFGWGLAGLLLFSDDQRYQLFLAFVIAGITAGAVSTLAAGWRALATFLPFAVLPLALQFITEGDEIATAAGFLILLYLAASLLSGKRANDTIVNALTARHAQSETQRELERIARTTDDGFWTWSDFSSNVQWWSDHMYEMLGFKPGEVVPGLERWQELVHRGDQETFFSQLEAGKTRREPFVIEFRAQSEEGYYTWFRVRAATEFDQYDEPTGMSGTMTDIDELVKEKTALAQSLQDLESYKTALDEHAIISMTDKDGKITHVNDALVELSQFSREELIGGTHKKINSGYHPTLYWETMWKTITQGDVWQGQVCDRAKDGTTFWTQTTIVPLRSDDGNIDRFMAIRNDITAIKEHEKTLTALMHDAQAGRTAQANFLSTMSHEIRTPLNGVLGMATLLSESRLDEEQTDYVRTILNSGEGLLTIINEILDFSKIEAGHLDLELVPFDLETATAEAVDLLALKARDKGLDFHFRYAPGTATQLIGDPHRIKQVLLNLLSNGLKFTSAGSVSVDVQEIETKPLDSLIKFSVRDSGIGVTAEQTKGLFVPFRQADQSTSRKFGGTGLGLAICKQLAELMGGEIGVESVPGQGSTFWFTTRLGKAPNAERADVPIGSPHVLVVDESDTGRALTEELLRSWGAAVESTDSSADAPTKLIDGAEDQRPFDFAILIHSGTEMEARAMAQSVKNNPQTESTCLVMLTASREKGDAQKFFNAGFSAYLPKPIAPSILKRAIVALLDPDRDPNVLVTRYTVAEAMNSDSTPQHEGSATSARVLVVDDNKVNQKVAKKMLERIGCTVSVAQNGQEAVEMVGAEGFDQIYMDCQMPVMDGFEATRTIRNSEKGTGKHVPIIAMTANAMEGDRRRCIESGMDDFLTKPVKAALLGEMVKKYANGVNVGDQS